MSVSPRHLLTVWNPSYSGDALDAHLAVLLEWLRRHARKESEEDEVYVWWGKIRSKNRDGRLPHHDAVLALDAQCRAGTETHLYLTDYRSLYVAHVGEITDEDVRLEDGETEHMPAYYAGHAFDFWFRLFDIRRLVSDGTPAVITEARKLRNVGYHDRPVSLYGGIVSLPLVVWRDPETAWFSGQEALTEGSLWATAAAEFRSDAQRMSAELRDNLFGRDLWAAMEPATRSFLASAETVFRTRRDDPGFDLSGPAVEYAKAVETELNALVFPALRRASRSRAPKDREVFVDGRRLDLGAPVPHQTLGALRVLLTREPVVQTGLRQQLPADANDLLGLVPRELEALVELRNAGAHSRSTTADTLIPVREKVLGIGGEGLLVRLVRARLRGR